MKLYNYPWDRDEFDKADRLVRAVLLQSGRAEVRTLRNVTYDAYELPDPDNRAYLDDNNNALGVCFGHEQDHVFDVWLSASFSEPYSDLFYDTVLHEMTHGYLGLYKHNQRFRRFFSRVLYHYSALVQPMDFEGQISYTIRRYTQQGAGEPLNKYVDRMHAEQTAAEKVAITEAPVVAQTYQRLTHKESR